MSSITVTETVESGGGCQDCNNTQDPISLDDLKDIPDNCLFKVKEGQVTNCFDIRQLYQYYEKSKKLENPLTRTPFTDDTLNRFLEQVTKLGIAKDNKVVQRATEMEQLQADTEMLRDFLTRPMDDTDFAAMENVNWSGALSRRRHRRSFQSDRHRQHRVHDEFVLNRDGTVTHSNITMPPDLARSFESFTIEQPVRTVVRTIERTSTITPTDPEISSRRITKETVTSYTSKLPYNPAYSPQTSTTQTRTSFSLPSISTVPSTTQSNRSFNMRLAQEREDMLSASRARTTSFSISTNPFQQLPPSQQIPHIRQPVYQPPFQQQPVYQPTFQQPLYQPQALSHPMPFAITKNVEVKQQPITSETETQTTRKGAKSRKVIEEKKGPNWLITFLLIALGGLLLMFFLPKIGSLFG